MSLNATPASERIHIGIFGKRNEQGTDYEVTY